MHRLLVALVASLALIVPPTASAIEIGWQDSAVSSDRAPEALVAAHALGAQRMRVIVHWREVQPSPGVWDWAKYDAAVDAARANGFSVQAVLGGIGMRPPNWTSPQDDHDLYGEARWVAISRAAFVNFAAGAAAHFRGRIDRWSILNEVELTGFPAARYARLFVQSRRAIRRWAPGSAVMWGEFAPFKPISYTLTALNAYRHTVVADGFSLHPYGMPGAPSKDEGDFSALPHVKRFVRSIRKSLHTGARHSLALYGSEYGCSLLDNDEDTCARQWAKAIPAATRLGLRQLVVYQLLAGPSETWDTSLVRADGSPRPAFAAIAAAL